MCRTMSPDSAIPKYLILIIAIAVLLSGTASAATTALGYGTHEVTITLQLGEDAAYVIPVRVGDSLKVDLRVTEGGPVDFYLTNLTAYNVYKASVSGYLNFPSLYYVADYSDENSDFIRYTYDSFVDNELVVVIDNTGFTQNGAAPIGPVSITGTITVEKNVWTPTNIAITIIVIIAIIAFMVGLRYRKKKA
jgi:hypothetical protein